MKNDGYAALDNMTAQELKELLVKQQKQNQLLEKERDILTQEKNQLNAEKEKLSEKVIRIEERLKLFQIQMYGRKSEKISKEDALQMRLFDELEMILEEPEPKASETTTIKEHTRKRGGRKKLPDHLERRDEVHDLSTEEKTCECGCLKKRIGEEITEKLEVIPPDVFVRRIVRPKYACKSCAESGDEERKAITIAPLPPQIIPKSYASPSLLAFMFTAKFEDALPFYRQEKQFARLNILIDRKNLSNWAIKVAAACEKIEELLWQEVLSGPVIQVDETPVQVLSELNRKDTSLSYMWVFRGGPPEKPIILYKYHPTRSKEIPELYLCDYQGFLQTDGYAAYDALGSKDGIRHTTCWAHTRRYFNQARKASKKNSTAGKGLEKIRKLYKIEKELRAQNLSAQEFQKKRAELVQPVFDDLKAWLDSTNGKVPPKSLTGKAITYALNQWHKLIRYIESPYLTPDTNHVENAIRPFTVGRKNWLFAGSPRGAFASAMLYSLIQTAKASDLNPYLYLKYIFEKSPDAKSKDDVKSLLPQNLTQQDIQPVL